MEEDKLSAFMESLGISTDDVWTLFLLIDKDDDGLVDIEQFVAGCMQLRGPAKSLQVAKMSYENRITREQIKRIVDDMDELKADVAKLVEARERKLASVLGPQAVSEAL
ncbi:Voltage-dependent calcium channel type A subunit alpha-1 [Durusdinium trenchii]